MKQNKKPLKERIESFEKDKVKEKLISHGKNSIPPNAMALAGRASTEIIAGIIVGGGIGVFLDNWLNTLPIFTIIFLFLGSIAGIMNLWRFLSGKDMALGFINEKENVKNKSDSYPK